MFVEYPTKEYFNWSLDWTSFSNPYLAKLLIDNPLIFGSIIAPDPGAVTLIVVLSNV